MCLSLLRQPLRRIFWAKIFTAKSPLFSLDETAPVRHLDKSPFLLLFPFSSPCRPLVIKPRGLIHTAKYSPPSLLISLVHQGVSGLGATSTRWLMSKQARTIIGKKTRSSGGRSLCSER
ncbi:hypothetical protein BDV98DRAFT_339253 [Pterulicium gracile]|uniref:Uncharacterized protein n=1 Tax=Pterulicium gracile TaxID=1884261 RepID=A0A5C3Q7D0_9AGAR|nr:hypothetical protein BDV98DRAFT_339253 [Pterula gracilis]